MNPVFIKEQMLYFRAPKLLGRTSLFTIFLAILILCVAFTLTYLTNGPWVLLGKHVLIILAVLLCTTPVRVLAIVDTIVGEKEHNTYNTLIVSALSPLQFIWGKMLHLIFQITLLQFQLLPLMFISYAFGGHSIFFIFSFYLVLLAHNGFLASMHLYLASIPMSHLSNRYTRFYTTYSIQKNMASSLTTVLCTVPVCFAVFSWINTIGSPGSVLGVLSSAQINSLKMICALSPIFTIYFWGHIELFGIHCPLWLFSVLLNLLLMGQLMITTETYHRNLENDPNPRFRLGLLFSFLILEVFVLAATFSYGLQIARAIPYIFCLLGATYILFQLGLSNFQPQEENFSWRQMILKNRSIHTTFMSLKSTSFSFFWIWLLASYGLYLFLLYVVFETTSSIQFFFIFFPLLAAYSFAIFCLAHFLSLLKNGSMNSRAGLTFLMATLYGFFFFAPYLIQKFYTSGVLAGFWMEVLLWIGNLMILLNPFALLLEALYQFEGYLGAHSIHGLFPLPLTQALSIFLASYFGIGIIFYLRARRNFLRFQKELPPPPDWAQKQPEATNLAEAPSSALEPV